MEAPNSASSSEANSSLLAEIARLVALVLSSVTTAASAAAIFAFACASLLFIDSSAFSTAISRILSAATCGGE